MKGAEYIVEFMYQRGIDKVFLITGGACAFIVDAIGRHPHMDYICFRHEQAAAMAADAVWRVKRKVGAAMATSGPGATNLLTGIACSYFDSIPVLHITGQVNIAESAAYGDAKVRQAGFQETKIVEMARPITKYAVQVRSGEELKRELTKAYNIAISSRMGPVLVDVPMNVQQEEVGDEIEYAPPDSKERPQVDPKAIGRDLQRFFDAAERPLVLFGAGVGLAGAEAQVTRWLESTGIPFVASWNALTYFNHDTANYHGHVGVYGNRGANYILQNCDALLVLGSRLDNRQRSGNPKSFAPHAEIHVIDIDAEEVKKYKANGYATTVMDLRDLPPVLENIEVPPITPAWADNLKEMKTSYFGRDISNFARTNSTISPYWVVQQVNRIIKDDAVVIADCGANLCWVYQIFHRTRHTLITAGGHSPMAYSLPATIGAALSVPDRQIVCFIGDGGFQLNMQELQTIYHYGLDITVVILNNYGYGIIKQFQDSYTDSRYDASGRGYGYSHCDFKALVEAFKLKYYRVNDPGDLKPELFGQPGGVVVDVAIDANTLIEPKLEMGRPIHDQFPYVSDEEFAEANRFVRYERVGRRGP